ncbi:histidine phosphatase family protein [Eubacteriaceae bacterium ES2]|nr:histidine phosphatase family protein [Eubacteriaceae bacterium ES2]
MKTKPYSLIILAAGYSSRMGQLKALLEIGGQKTISRLLRAAQLAGISETVVVTGYKTEEVEEAVKDQRIKCVYNEAYDDGMFSSIKKGLQVLNPLNQGFFILPVDYALVNGKLLSNLIEVFEAHPRAFVVPTFMGKKGHPPLFPMSFRQEILDSVAPSGLKAVTKKHQTQMIKTPTHFEGAVFDMDKPEDYQQALAIYKNKQIPDEKICLTCLKQNKTPQEVIAHSQAVAKLAAALACAFNQICRDQVGKLNTKLLYSAGLLHDIARTQAKHAQKGAEILESYGWDQLADLTKNHMFYTKDDNDDSIGELDLLCLADKCFIGSEFVSLAKRKERVVNRFKDDLPAVEAIEKRFAKADQLQEYLELKTGLSLESIYKDEKNRQPEVASKKIILIRHGQPVQHQDKIFLGQTDIGLSDEGRKDGEKAFDLLTERKFTRIYTSSLKRARETADILCQKLLEQTGSRPNLIEVPAFAEMNLGKWDGRLIKDIKKEFPRAYEERGNNRLTYKICGGENYYDLSYRVNKALFELLKNESEETIVIVTHAGVMAVIRSFLQDLPLEQMVDEKCGYGQSMTIDLQQEIYWPGW